MLQDVMQSSVMFEAKITEDGFAVVPSVLEPQEILDVLDRVQLSASHRSRAGIRHLMSDSDVPRAKKVVANCPLVDWSILPHSEKTETSNPNYAAYVREAFGNAYRLSDRNWNKLRSGTFYNPALHADEIEPSKIVMFHAQDDPYVPYSSVKKFAERTGVKLRSFRRGRHLRTEYIVRKYWPEIRKVFDA